MEGFPLVGGAQAAEGKVGVVSIQRQEFQKRSQFFETITDFRRVRFMGFAIGSKVTPPEILCDVPLEIRKKQVISFEKRTEMRAYWHNSFLRTIVRCGIVKERLGASF